MQTSDDKLLLPDIRMTHYMIQYQLMQDASVHQFAQVNDIARKCLLHIHMYSVCQNFLTLSKKDLAYFVSFRT